jgi:hypothetical protein
LTISTDSPVPDIPIFQSLLSGENQKWEKRYEIPLLTRVFFNVEKVSPLFMSGKLGSLRIEIANDKLLWLPIMSNSNQIAGVR